MPEFYLADALAVAIKTPALRASTVGLDVNIRFVCGSTATDLHICDGTASLATGDTVPDITICADESAWTKLLGPSPPPRFNSFTALQIKNDEFEVSGDALAIAQARAALEDIVEAFRPSARTGHTGTVDRDLALIEGRYANLKLTSEGCDIYFEMSGRGRPVVLLHTAGADSRQYQHILSDVEIARHWRMIAFDMPFHGRSFPLSSWAGDAYSLSQQAYAQIVIAFIEQIVREPVVLAGCSMGAAITLVIASQRPDLLLGAIALEPPLRSPGRRNAYLAHAKVAGGLHNSAYVRGLMSPGSPIQYRKQAEWIYSQGAPHVYAGDLQFSRSSAPHQPAESRR
jgi:hypothetical protein